MLARGDDMTPACRPSSRARTGPSRLRRNSSRRQRPGFAEPDSYPVDARGLAYTMRYIGIKRLGAGQFYLISIKDKDGESYDGGKDLPPDRAAECAGRAVLVGDRLRPARPTR